MFLLFAIFHTLTILYGTDAKNDLGEKKWGNEDHPKSS